MFSRITVILCSLVMAIASFVVFPKWQHNTTEATISWDVSGYYWYLPSIFIYKDIKHQSFKDSVLKKYGPTNNDFQQAMRVDNGNYVMKYSMGMAVMYLPFFTAAHLVARPLGYPPDGFSRPYQFAIQMGGLLISILGLWYLRKLLLLYYEDAVVAISMIVLVLGSNYFNYAAIDCGMSHCWLFTLYVFLLLSTHYFYRTYKLKYAFSIGVLVGLATLTRPTEIISALIPLLWGLENISPAAIIRHFRQLFSRYRQLVVAALCAAAVISLQLFYWKYASGHWLVYSYGNGQKIYLRSPNFLNYTLSYRSGWLTYSPMMFFAFIGILPYLQSGNNKVAIITFFLLDYYLICCWNIWWFGGRAMIQSYPVLIFPIAELIKVASQKKGLALLLSPFALLFVYFNIWLTINSHGSNGLYDPESMNRRYFWRVAGRWDVPENTAFLKDSPDLYERQPQDARLIYQNDFADDTSSIYKSDTGKYKYLLLTNDHQNSPAYSFALDRNNGAWLRGQAEFECYNLQGQWYEKCQFILRLIDKTKQNADRVVKENVIIPSRILDPGRRKLITLDMRLPDIHFDSANLIIWNGGHNEEVRVRHLKAFQFGK